MSKMFNGIGLMMILVLFFSFTGSAFAFTKVIQDPRVEVTLNSNDFMLFCGAVAPLQLASYHFLFEGGTQHVVSYETVPSVLSTIAYLPNGVYNSTKMVCKFTNGTTRVSRNLSLAFTISNSPFDFVINDPQVTLTLRPSAFVEWCGNGNLGDVVSYHLVFQNDDESVSTEEAPYYNGETTEDTVDLHNGVYNAISAVCTMADGSVIGGGPDIDPFTISNDPYHRLINDPNVTVMFSHDKIAELCGSDEVESYHLTFQNDDESVLSDEVVGNTLQTTTLLHDGDYNSMQISCTLPDSSTTATTFDTDAFSIVGN